MQFGRRVSAEPGKRIAAAASPPSPPPTTPSATPASAIPSRAPTSAATRTAADFRSKRHHGVQAVRTTSLRRLRVIVRGRRSSRRRSRTLGQRVAVRARTADATARPPTSSSSVCVCRSRSRRRRCSAPLSAKSAPPATPAYP